jgi:hypothetical protein
VTPVLVVLKVAKDFEEIKVKRESLAIGHQA